MRNALMLNSQLQFHLEAFSSKDDVTEGHGDPERKPLNDDKQDSKRADEQKAKSSVATDCDSFCGSCVSLGLSFLAGLLAQPTFQGILFRASILCLLFAATVAVLKAFNKRKVALRRSMLQRTRGHISYELCRMGAPPLDVAPETQKYPSFQQLDSFTSMTRLMSEWIETVDRMLEFLQTSTSIKLGLGAASVSVGRIELAALRKAKVHTSLSSLRRRLFAKMIQINSSLLEICGKNFVHEDDDLDSDVVTLLALKLVRQETTCNISRVLNHSFASPLEDDAVVRKESLQRVVSEAIAYFAGIFDPEDITHHDDGEHELRGRLQSILIDAQGLQTCLHASCESASTQLEHCDLAHFLDEAKSFLEKIQSAFDKLSFGNAGLDNDASVLAPIHSSNENVQAKIPGNEALQEFHTEGCRGDDRALLCEQYPSKTNKVLVFSGRGDVKINATRREKNPNVNNESSYDGYRYQNVENKLLAELLKHLNSLPKRIEEDVSVEPADEYVGYEGSPRSYASVSSENIERVVNIFPRRPLGGAFLSELTKQIPTLCSRDDFDGIVADNHQRTID